MIVRLLKIENNIVFLYVERTQGRFNSMHPLYTISDGNLTNDEKCTLAWDMLKETLYSSFDNIWASRHTGETTVYDYTTEYEQQEIIAEDGTTETKDVMIWGGREDVTQINPDTLPTAMPPRDEPVVFDGFNYIASIEKEIRISNIPTITQRSAFSLTADIYDQYGKYMKATDPVLVDTSKVGAIDITFKYNSLSLTVAVTVTERVLSDLEQMKILLANQMGGAY